MAHLNAWLAAAMILLLGLVPSAVVIMKRKMADGLAALQLAGTITILATLFLAVGFGRSTLADIPMALAVLSFPSSLLFAHFLERWL